MILFNELLNEFAQGAVRYSDHYLEDTQNRIVLNVRFESSDFIQVIVDTGAVWPILDPKIAEELGIDYQSGYETPGMKIRGVKYPGWLCRLVISLVAEHGNSLDIDGTVFVPKLPYGEDWLKPNFLGVTGFLDRVRFAVDPVNNVFYFGLPT